MENQKQHQKVRPIVIGNSEKQKSKHANDYFEFVIKSFLIIFQAHYFISFAILSHALLQSFKSSLVSFG